MQQKQRYDSATPLAGGGNPGDGADPTSHLDNLRERSNQLLAAADEAINRALANSDSEAFLQANRQQGGE